MKLAQKEHCQSVLLLAEVLCANTQDKHHVPPELAEVCGQNTDFEHVVLLLLYPASAEFQSSLVMFGLHKIWKEAPRSFLHRRQSKKTLYSAQS